MKSKHLRLWNGKPRFQKRIRLGNWLALNLSRQGISLSIGRRGLRMNLNRAGFFVTVGVPGSGWSYRGGLGWKRLYDSFKQLQKHKGDER